MNTTSQTKLANESKNSDFILYKVEINFDESSIAWRANKKHIGTGHFKYKCLQKTQTGNDCKREALQGLDTCKCHSKNK